MSTTPRSNSETSHVERTAAEPRDDSLHKVILGDVKQVNNRIRVLRLDIPKDGPSIKFLPGQWLDVHVPGITKPGGFTITSTPLAAQLPQKPFQYSTANGDIKFRFLELAVQRSPDNPPAAWLWRSLSDILGRELHVRVGGSFVWPPVDVALGDIKRVVFVAGGVGINPFMAMIGHIAQSDQVPLSVSLIYSVRDPGDEGLSSILYLESLAGLYAAGLVNGELILHLTSEREDYRSLSGEAVELAGWRIECRRRRITKDDLLDALGSVDERRNTLVYVCGVPVMIDELVSVAEQAPGMDSNKVLCERWW